MLDLLKRLIRQQTVTIPETVTNLHGAVPGFVTDAGSLPSSVWQRAALPYATMLSADAFYAAWVNQAARVVTTHPVTSDGTTVVAQATEQLMMVRGQIRTTGSRVFPLTVVTAGSNEAFAVYLDGVLMREARGQISLALPVSAGDHIVEVLTTTRELGLGVSTIYQLSPDFEQVPTPTWNAVTTDYLDASTSATTTVHLSWYAASRAGSWNVLRRTRTSVSTVMTVGQQDAQGMYSISVQGDHADDVPPYAQLYVGSDALGTVLMTTYDPTATTTAILLLLPASQATPRTTWVGQVVDIAPWTVIRSVVNSGSSALLEVDDIAVKVGTTYEYALQAFGLFNGQTASSLSDIRLINAGDSTPPASITFKSGYPLALNKRITARYTTPADSDYAGVRVYYRLGMTGVSQNAKAAGSTILDSAGVSWTNNQWAGYRMMVYAGAGVGQDLLISSNDGSTLIFTTPLLYAVDTSTRYRIYKNTLVITDTGTPSSDDETTFSPLGEGEYLFLTFDRAGNQQDQNSGVVYSYSFSNDTFTGVSNAPPTINIKQVSLTEQANFSGLTDSTRYTVLELGASDPADGTTGVTLYYQLKGGNAQSMPASTNAVGWAVDNPSGTRSRYVALDRLGNQTWIRVWAIDQTALQSDVMTYSIDFDEIPSISSLESRMDPGSDTVYINGAVDDDTRSLKWWVSPDDTVNPTSAAPLHIDLGTLKTFALNVAVNDGEKKTVTMIPYASWNSGTSQVAGAAGVTVAREFTRTPRSTASFEDRNEQGQVSATRIKATFRMTPTPVVVASGSTTSGTQPNAPVDNTKGFSTTEGAASNYISSGQRFFYIRLTSGTMIGQTRKIIGHTTAQTMNLETPFTLSNGTASAPADGTTYEIINGAVLYRLDGGAYQPAAASEFFNRSEGAVKGRTVDFYATINGCPAESLQTVFVDDDTKASLGSVAYSIPTTGKLKVRINGWDDDAKSWRAYEKKGNWPTKKSDGTQGGEFDPVDPDYLRWTAGIDQTEYTHTAADGVWYVIAIPTNSYNDDGDRVTSSINVASPPAALGDLSGLLASAHTSTANKIAWTHNSAAFSSTPKHSVKVYAYREDLGVGTKVELTAGTTRLVNLDAGVDTDNSNDTDTASNVGSYVHASPGTRSTLGAGGVLRTWKYSVELYDGTGALVSTYPVDFADYYVNNQPDVSAASVSVWDSGDCNTDTGACTDPFVLTVTWSVANANDTDFRLDLSRSSSATPSSYTLVASGLSTTATSYTHTFNCVYVVSTAALRYYTYKIEVVRKADGVVVDSATTSTLSAHIATCVKDQSGGSGGGKA